MMFVNYLVFQWSWGSCSRTRVWKSQTSCWTNYILDYADSMVSKNIMKGKKNHKLKFELEHSIHWFYFCFCCCCFSFGEPYTKTKGRIVHRSGLNNENNKIKIKNSFKSKMKDFIFNSTMVKADIFWVTEKNRVY